MDIVGRLVRLRAWRPDDAEAVAAILRDPRMVAGLDHWSRVPYGVEQARDFVTRPDAPPERRWAVECIEDGALIGATGLHGIDHLNRHAVWGIWIGPPEIWGRGYGTETCMLATDYAFRHLGLEKVMLTVYLDNPRARRTYEKAGYRSEGVLRRHIWLNGALRDLENMAVFSDDPLYADPTG